MKSFNFFILYVFVFIICVNVVLNAFLMFPLRSKKTKNINIDRNNIQYQKYFKSDFTTKDFVEDWYLRTMTIDLEAGKPSRHYLAEIMTNSTPFTCVTLDKYQKKDNINYFQSSKSFENTSEVRVYENLGRITIRGDFKDFFRFKYKDSNTITYKDVKIDFNLKSEFNSNKSKSEIDYLTLNKTNTFIFAMQLYNEIHERSPKIWINYLKELDLIDSYDFVFEFYNNPSIDPNSEDDEIGNLIFGKFEELYNPEVYPISNLRSMRLKSHYQELLYLAEMTEMYIEKDKKIVFQENNNIYFNFDTSLFSGTFKYHDRIDENFFKIYENGNMCTYERVEGLSDEKTPENIFGVYVCNKELIEKHKKDFPLLKFYSKELNYTFEFGYDDLFREINNKVYFLVIFPNAKYRYTEFHVGKVFLKKYKMFFNYKDKMLFFYDGPLKKIKFCCNRSYYSCCITCFNNCCLSSLFLKKI